MNSNPKTWLYCMANFGTASFCGLALVAAQGQTLPVAGDAQQAIAQDQAERAAIAQREAARAQAEATTPQRDGIRGVREQDQAARQTADRLNRDARQQARQQLDQTFRNQMAMNAGLRGADLGLWFSSQPGAGGLMVSDVANQGAFARAGLREGDRILSINGQPVTSEAQFLQTLTSPSLANQLANITVARGGQQQTFSLQTSALLQGVAARDPVYEFGLLLDERNPNRLVVQRVFSRTPAFYAGLRPGDVITSVNGQPIASLNSLVQALQSGAGGNLGLVVTRNGRPRQLNLGIDDGSIRTALRPTFSADGSAGGTVLPVQPGPAAVPGAPTAVPGAPTAVPGAPTAVPGAPTAVPGAPTAVPGPSSSQGTVNPAIRGGASPPTGDAPGIPAPGGTILTPPSSQGTVDPAIRGGANPPAIRGASER